MPGSPFPRIIHVEPTTRCNMRCRMCVKNVLDKCEQDGDLPVELFERLSPSLELCSRVVFAGVGEPLLHPSLADMIRFARRRLPPQAGISMQTNGLLMSAEKAAALVNAGLDTVCISVDSLDGADGGSLHGAAHLDSVARAFASVRSAAKGKSGNASGKGVQLGAEIVLMKSNVSRLADLVRWVGEQGADFVIVSHVFAYAEEAAGESLFNPNPDQARAYFDKWRAVAASEGLDFNDYYKIIWKLSKTESQKRLMELVNLMQREANANGVWMNVRSLFEWNAQDGALLRMSLEQARLVAREFGMVLTLPPMVALHERRCGFMEEGAAFVSRSGEISPCHFLWRNYRCVMGGERKRVRAKSFGNIGERRLEEIWNGEEYRHFRLQALAYEYPYCSSCNGGPCSDVTAFGAPFEEDCTGAKAPCCHCPWPVGQLACLT